jgi:hypothetical protein
MINTSISLKTVGTSTGVTTKKVLKGTTHQKTYSGVIRKRTDQNITALKNGSGKPLPAVFWFGPKTMPKCEQNGIKTKELHVFFSCGNPDELGCTINDRCYFNGDFIFGGEILGTYKGINRHDLVKKYLNDIEALGIPANVDNPYDYFDTMVSDTIGSLPETLNAIVFEPTLTQPSSPYLNPITPLNRGFVYQDCE